MSIDHNRIKISDLESNLPNKVLITDNDGKLEFSDIYNALDCIVEGKVLDARQGKVLKNSIDNINALLASDNLNLDTVQELVDAIGTVQNYLNTILVNDLTAGGTTKALTAEMGKMLKALIDGVVTNKVDKIAGERLINTLEIAKLAAAGDMLTNADQIVSGQKTFLSGKFGLRSIANTFTSFFTNSNTASRTYVLQDRNGTLADLTDIASVNTNKMNVPIGGVAHYLPKFLTATTQTISRLWDTGSKLGIGTVKTPTDDITLGNQSNRTIAVEQINNTSNGKDLSISAGRTINFVEGTGFQSLFFSVTTWAGLVVEPISQDVYVAITGGNIYKRTGGGGDFINEGTGSSSFYRGMGCDIYGNIYIAIATGGYRKKAIGGSTWVQITPTGISGTPACIAGDFLGNLYIGTSSGLFKQTDLTGSFVQVYSLTGVTSLAISPITGDIYINNSDNIGGIYKQTGGLGSFELLQHSPYGRSLVCTVSGDNYVALGGGILGKQTAGTGAFISEGISTGSGSWCQGMSSNSDSSLYSVTQNGDICFLDKNEVGAADLNGGTISLKAGTGKGAGKSRWDVWTGQKTTSGTNMQAPIKRIEVDELGALLILTEHSYTDNTTALAAGLRIGSLYWDANGNMKRVI